MQCSSLHISVLGLGYVGLPLAQALSVYYPVVGFDVDASKLSGSTNRLVCSSDTNDIASCNVYIIAVPTPLTLEGNPDLGHLVSATEVVARCLSIGDIVVYESTVFPGCSEEVCVPILEKISGLNYKQDFGVAYSPERINPGDEVHRLDNVVKIVAASDEGTLSVVKEMYGKIVKAGLHVAPSIRVAEAAKLVENTQRDVNIALMNELSMMFSKMGLDTDEVLKAAKTKWNFHSYSPGLVGGYCIGVSPRYLSYKSDLVGHEAKLIKQACTLNEGMAEHVASSVVKHLVRVGRLVSDARVLLMGVTYKENVSDVRSSKAMEVAKELEAMGVKDVSVYDPCAKSEDVMSNYGVRMVERIEGVFDVIIIAVAHKEFGVMVDQEFVDAHLVANGLLADLKGVCRGRVEGYSTWYL